METFNINENNIIDDTPYEKNQEDNNDIDEIIVMYFFKFCGCPSLLFLFVFIFFLWFPPLPILVYCCEPYKRIIRIDKKNNILLIYNTGFIPCCKLNPKSYSLNNIKNIRIYVYSLPDPKIGFSKLYYINCEIYSLNGDKEDLFKDRKYDKEAIDRYESFFKKYFQTEIEPLEVAKDKSEYIINEQKNN